MGRMRHLTKRSKLWSEPVEHNRDSEWLKKSKEKLIDTQRRD